MSRKLRSLVSTFAKLSYSCGACHADASAENNVLWHAATMHGLHSLCTWGGCNMLHTFAATSITVIQQSGPYRRTLTSSTAAVCLHLAWHQKSRARSWVSMALNMRSRDRSRWANSGLYLCTVYAYPRSRCSSQPKHSGVSFRSLMAKQIPFFLPRGRTCTAALKCVVISVRESRPRRCGCFGGGLGPSYPWCWVSVFGLCRKPKQEIGYAAWIC